MAYSSFPPEIGAHSPWGPIESITPLGSHPPELFMERSGLSDLQLVERCKYAVRLGPFMKDPDLSKAMAMVRGDLAAALERPAVMAAFADSYSHPDMVVVRIESGGSDDWLAAMAELSSVRDGLVDQFAAAETQQVLETLQRLAGPTPWDTFYATRGEPDKALMPLYGCRNSGALGLGPIDGPGELWSAGGQALFYPVGGYERFAEATSVVVAQNLADGLAIEAALLDDKSCAVIVASAPDGVFDVSWNVSKAVINRAAIAPLGEPQLVGVVAALCEAEGADSAEVLQLIQEAPVLGMAVVRPGFGEADVPGNWPVLRRDAIADAVRSAQVSSNERMADAAEPDLDRFDFGPGFRESVRDLRESTREASLALAAEAPAKIEREQTRPAARRM